MPFFVLETNDSIVNEWQNGFYIRLDYLGAIEMLHFLFTEKEETASMPFFD